MKHPVHVSATISGQGPWSFLHMALRRCAVTPVCWAHNKAQHNPSF